MPNNCDRCGAVEAALRTLAEKYRNVAAITSNPSRNRDLQVFASELEAIREAALPPPTQKRQPSRMEITYELGNKFWHTNCPKNSFRSGIMKAVGHEPKRSLIECLHCGQQGYYPVGSVGPVCAEIVGGEAALPPQEPK